MHRFSQPAGIPLRESESEPDTVMAPLGEGHTAEMKDGEYLVGMGKSLHAGK